MEFSSCILHWYYKNQRNLPWRASNEAYNVWISEVILQQTRVAQGLGYYNRFIATFPNIKDLANASEDQVLKLWQGLGYYSRARNIHSTAKHISSNFDGKFPNTYKEIIKLKGVGPYTAAAISSICFNEKQAAVDGNVYRVLSRVFNISTPINSTQGIKEFQLLADTLISDEKPGDYKALMELGATVCTPKKADCTNCPLESMCLGYSKGTFSMLPVKIKKIKIRKRNLNYYCIEQSNSVLMNQRTGKDIWRNLFDFPLQENDSATTEPDHQYLTKLIGDESYTVEKTNYYKHKLSHQVLSITIHHIKTSKLVAIHNYELFSKSQTLELAVPKPIELFLSEFISKKII